MAAKNELQKRLRLTTGEIDCLNHRLEVSDCIAEVLANDFSEDLIGTICDLLNNGRFSEAEEIDANATEAVLIDCVERSTWFGCVPVDMIAARSSAARVLSSLGRKIGTFYDRELSIPLH